MEPCSAIYGPVCSIFFIFVVLIGKYLLINLLVAVILTEFADDDAGPNSARSAGSSARGPVWRSNPRRSLLLLPC